VLVELVALVVVVVVLDVVVPVPVDVVDVVVDVVMLHGPQIPSALPVGMTHVSPEQQSALLVHPPHAATHEVAPHTNGGIPPGVGLGTQGKPLQQFALEAHAPPALTHCSAAQRGMPTLSNLQVFFVLQLPLQQSHEALHIAPGTLHTSPSGLQPWGFWQTPIVNGAVLLHVTGLPGFAPGSPAAPQQS